MPYPARMCVKAALLAGLGAALAHPALAGAPAAQCYSPDALAARPGEAGIQKGNRTFDKPPPSSPLAAFEPVPATLRGVIRRVRLPAGRKLVALTLDLCESPGEIAGYDGHIFDYLRREGVPATLFAGGKWMRSHGDRLAQLMSDPLFEIANHGEAHRNLRLLAGPALEAEIAGPQRAYEAARRDFSETQCVRDDPALMSRVPQRISLFRFPFGACHAASIEAVNAAGLLAIQWDVSTGDPSPAQSARAIAAAMIRNTRPGSIIIAHANGRGFHTAQALPLAIPKLKAQGYEFVTVSELLAAGTPEIVSTCYDSKPGDTDRYDKLFLAKARRPDAKAPAKNDAPRALQP